MSFGAELREVTAELWADRGELRAVFAVLLLATLGLVILMGFGEGMHVAMRAALSRSGAEMLRYSAGSTTVPWRGLAAGRTMPLAQVHADAMRALPGVRDVTAEFRTTLPLQVDGRATSAAVLGVEPGYPRIRGMTVREGGRFLSPQDLSERRRVACLGEDLAHDLFGAAEPIGASVRIGGTPFLVVGVVPRRLMLMQYGGDDATKAFVPATVATATFGLRQVHHVLVHPVDPAAHRAIDAAVRARLSPQLGFDPTDRGALRVVDHIANASEIGVILIGVRTFLALMGILGLLVAALGVGNAMFARVEAKRREIGLRRALGATRRVILLRHLLEGACVVGAGGAAGSVLAVALLAGLDAIPFDAMAKAYLGSPVPSAGTALVVGGLLGTVALLAGLQPARAAAGVPPVEALRHE